MNRKSTLTLSSMDSYTPTPITWLWDQRLACGKLAILAGDPGLGKSFLTLDLAARVSRDGIMPDGFAGPCGDVVLLSAEDDPADTLQPRLVNAGANLDRVHFVRGVTDDRSSRLSGFDLTQLDALAGMFKTVKPRLLIIDPISAYLGDTDSNNNSQVRGLLAPLAQLAGEFGCCVLAVSHLNKSGEGNAKAIYRTMGSLAFVAAARSAWLVTRHKHRPSMRLFSQVKNNLGTDRKAISYEIVNGALVWDTTGIDIDADDAMQQQLMPPGRPDDSRQSAVTFLQRTLAEGSISFKRLQELAEKEQIHERTLRRAADEVGVIRSGSGARTVWSLKVDTAGTNASPSAMFD